MNTKLAISQRRERKYLPVEFAISNWENLTIYFDELMSRPINSLTDLKEWFIDRDEVESVVSEDSGWRYIRMTQYTDNAEYRTHYQDFVNNIQPHLAQVNDKLNRRAVNSEWFHLLATEPGFNILARNLKKDIDLFREENVPLFTEISLAAQKYAELTGAMSIEWAGKQITLQQASVLLLEVDRAVRESVFYKIVERRLKDKDKFNELYSQLIQLRHQVALNAGFKNFRDYMFKAYSRFDYTPKDCFDFHEAIASEVVPLIEELSERRKQTMQLDTLRPWDKAVDEQGRPPLKAFDSAKDLTEKAIQCLNQLDPTFGKSLSIMNQIGHLDLDSRQGKAPGGYNYPLPEIGIPFIFMNATSTLYDLTTLMHESGHAVHNFLTGDLPLYEFKNPPMEVAELASMTMELISMEHWNVFFPNPNELKRAVTKQLEGIVETLPWVATIDKFQHRIYENPTVDLELRKQNWNIIHQEFSDSVTSWAGLEMAKDFLWQKQLHLFEVPFYFIEYGMAQLGAIAIWRNFKKDKAKGLAGYKNLLKAGNTKTIPELYSIGGIKFDFSKDYIRELMAFVRSELLK